MVWTPLLRVLGFDRLGPGAGAIAAAIQRYIHPVVPRGIFAIFQGARMGGGYGMGVLNRVERGGIGLVGGGYWYKRFLKGDEARKETKGEPMKKKEYRRLHRIKKELFADVEPMSERTENNKNTAKMNYVGIDSVGRMRGYMDVLFVYLAMVLLFYCYIFEKETLIH
ncbi:hypothetical protein I302_101230 [Kwoniella bestiolae CBS 10118]|uniref:Uncharacterized protein n=1 Tax=Kwoniella bestiolae CBS 10118 TaxID=1296100 RepID=A0A1B9G7B9_9TREE|nr:hypothetical protein I302_04603 [Kwoniella bestiolae CBS 10118]OCF26912.1 hypothetical protein I302_04603 [Kwoniella bestiolae CBS 10118]